LIRFFELCYPRYVVEEIENNKKNFYNPNNIIIIVLKITLFFSKLMITIN